MKKLKVLTISALSLFVLSACGTQSLTPLPQINEQTLAQNNEQQRFNRTAKKELWLAESKARSWDISARLVKVEARNVREDGTALWDYYFKSPFKRNVLLVEAAGFTREVRDDFFGYEFDEFEWKLDSDKAIEAVKEKGLDRFPVIEMKLEDRFSSLEWELRTYKGFYRVNARTGTVSRTER